MVYVNPQARSAADPRSLAAEVERRLQLTQEALEREEQAVAELRAMRAEFMREAQEDLLLDLQTVRGQLLLESGHTVSFTIDLDPRSSTYGSWAQSGADTDVLSVTSPLVQAMQHALLPHSRAPYELLQLCDDCVLWAANNDDSGASESWLQRVTPEARSRIGTLVPLSGESRRTAFSTSDCHGCGDTLAGSRTEAVER
jgi:hypothetical protein